jgi:hypothetical protein
MPIAVNDVNNGTWSDGRRLHFVRKLVFSGSYVALGDALNLGLYSIKSATVPFYVNVYGQTATPYAYRFVPGATLATCKLLVVNSTTGVELAAGAYPAGITGDTVTLYGITVGMQ